MFFGKKGKNTELEIQIYDSIEKLEAGERSYLKIAYEAMAFENREMVKKAGHGIKKCLETATAKQMITLSERFREYSSLDWFVDWKNVDMKEKKTWFGSEQEYVYALIVGSFHPNGYFREACSKELYNYPNTLGYMLLRVNDWVTPIRKNMFLLALRRLESCTVMELFLSLQHMEKLSRSGRVDYEEVSTLERIFYQRIEDTLPDFPLEKIKYYEFTTRKIIYRLLIKKQILNLSQINYLLEREKHSFCKQILITGTLQYYDCSKEQVEKYLRNKSEIVRRKALEYQYSVLKKYWDGLEMMLLDKNKGVRELTAYIIRHHSDIQILNFYIEHLQDENPVAAIVGIGEQGDKESGKLLLPFLKSPINKVVCTTLRALAKTIGIEGYDIYPQYLVNKEPAISKAAYCAIQYSTIHYGPEKLHQYCTHYEYPHIKKYALLLLFQENSWNRLPFLLDLYGTEDFEKYQELILEAIATRDMYGKISKQQAEVIDKILKEKEKLLPQQLVKNILFDMKFLIK